MGEEVIAGLFYLDGKPISEFMSFDSWCRGEIIQRTPFQKLSAKISKVIFNEPATIILWKDGSKTVVKTQDDEPFDREKGFLMAVMKYLNDGKANFNNVIKEWCDE
jgi:hypothetical protein